MTRLQFTGAWEGDCLANGRHVASFPDGRLVTNNGEWRSPEWLRYPRLNPVRDAASGTTQNSNRIIEGAFSSWVDKGSACGTNACAYWPDGTLVTNPDCGAPYYGLGIRYISDRIYTAEETYADPIRQVYEYTTHDGITVGQGGAGRYGEDPCVMLYNGRRYLLERGTCRVVRFHKQGEHLAVGFFRMDDGGSFVAHWLTVADIPTLEDITDTEDPEDPDEPDEPEEPDVDFPLTEWGVVEEMHDHFAGDFPATEDGARRWTEKTIQQLAFSFPQGGWCWKSSTPNSPPSKDCIARQVAGRFEGWDVLSAAGASGPRHLADYPPSYHDLKAEGNQNPIPVTPHDWLGEEPPPPSSDLEDRVTVLEAEAEIQAARIRNLEDRVSALEQEQPPDSGMTPAQVVALIDSAFANAVISGRTQSAGGILSHSHGVQNLSIRRQ